VEAHLLYDTLSQQRLDPFKLAYNRHQLDGQLSSQPASFTDYISTVARQSSG